MKRYAWILALPFLMGTDGCEGEGGETGETGDTGLPEYSGAYQVSAVTYGCTAGSPDSWLFDIMTDGLAGSIELQWANTGDCEWQEYNEGAELSGCEDKLYTARSPTAIHDETHLFSNNVDWDSDDSVDGDGYIYSWDRWDMSLDDVATIAEIVPGSKTLLDCSFHSETNSGTATDPEWEGASMAYMITMYDSGGTALDCVIWGEESQDYWNTYKSNSCFCMEQDCTD